MKTYWIMYSVCLIGYILFSYLWIRKHKGMNKLIKIRITSMFMLGLFLLAIRNVYWLEVDLWRVVFLIPSSIGIWATVVDASLGLLLHKDPFYLGDSWPDAYIKRITNGGSSYAAYKIIFLMVTIPLNQYIQ